MSSPMPTTTLPCGETIPILGQGTWHMGENVSNIADEVAALRLGLDLGISLIDTAEMYGSGGAEEVVAEAIRDRRDEVFLVSKVLPSNAGHAATLAACERSLQRMATDRIDLYLLHWRSGTPLGETIDAFEALKADGKIRHWGVSNFDAGDMNELASLPHGDQVQTNQVLYNLTRRGIEFDLAQQCRSRGIPIMAYSPVEQGALARNGKLDAIAARHNATAAQIALAWAMAQPGTIAIPKAVKPDHVRQNAAALDIKLTAQDMAEIDRTFPPPSRPQSLDIT